jgi:hypothetical protein
MTVAPEGDGSIADIDRLVAEAAIRRVLHRYTHAADRCDTGLLASAYHPDGVDEHGSHFVGLGSAFATWAGEQRDVFVAGAHHVTTVRIDVQGDVAAAESGMFGLVQLASGQVSWSSGRYLDRLERRDGEWGITHRLFVKDVALPVPAHRDEPAEATTGAAPSARSILDPSYALFAAVASGAPWPA